MKKKLLDVTLKVIAGPSHGQKKTFSQDVIQVGRMTDCDFSIADPTISRKHFELIVGSNQVLLRNISEKNKVLLNGEAVNQVLLQPNDKLAIGESEIVVSFQLSNGMPNDNEQGNIKKSEKNLGIRNQSSGLPSQVPSAIAQNNQVVSSPLDLQLRDKPANPPSAMAIMKEAERPFTSPHASAKAALPRSGNPLIFLVVLLVVITGVGVFLLQGSKSNQKKIAPLREAIITMQNIQKSKEEIETFQKENSQTKNPSYERAHENFLKGFREYRNGNYARAMEYFASALAFFPDHVQANRYYMLANRKNDEFAQHHFNLGKKYYGIQNYRLCSAHFSVVIKVKKDEKDPIRKEAIQYLTECDVKREVRY